MERKTIVCWPEIQYLMEQDGFRENCELIVAGPDYKKYDDSAYYVDDVWLSTVDEEIRNIIL